jgi:endonuclease YncB( thermonuclease family)
MSGWDDAPEYGGPPWRWRDYAWTIAVVVLLAFGIAYCSSQAGAQPSQSPFSSLRAGERFGGIATVYDADTIRIEGQRVRLWGIDAPEIDQTCSNRSVGVLAAHHLTTLMDGQRVTCEVRMRPNRGRAVAQCWLDSRDLAASVIDAGWAWDSSEFSRGYYADIERSARSRRIGLWALQTCEAPWDYRAASRRNRRSTVER